MARFNSLSVLLAVSFMTLLSGTGAVADPNSYNPHLAALERRYSTPHSLGDNYQFDSRDGWMTVNVSNLAYKYARSLPEEIEEDLDSREESEAPQEPEQPEHGNYSVAVVNHKRSSKLLKKKRVNNHSKFSSRSSKSSNKKKSTSKKSSSKKLSSKASKASTTKSNTKSLLGSSLGSKASSLTSSVQNIIKSMTGTGKAEPVTITWYTGHDLLNPSCWSNPSWHPTDQSMACAVTLEGWTSRPQCFKFIELCNTSKKCVFTRVVDSCAGCAKGSKHVDLTKGAFTGLADLEEGLLTVQMRPATDPDGWVESLWGPQSAH